MKISVKKETLSDVLLGTSETEVSSQAVVEDPATPPQLEPQTIKPDQLDPVLEEMVESQPVILTEPEPEPEPATIQEPEPKSPPAKKKSLGPMLMLGGATITILAFVINSLLRSPLNPTIPQANFDPTPTPSAPTNPAPMTFDRQGGIW